MVTFTFFLIVLKNIAKINLFVKATVLYEEKKNTIILYS